MADESRPLYTGPTPPKPPSQVGESLFGVLEEQRKQQSAIDLLGAKSEIKQKENIQEAELTKTLEALRSSNRMAEAKFAFDQSKAHEALTNEALNTHWTSMVQSLIDQGYNPPGMTTPPIPEEPGVPRKPMPLTIPPMAAPAAEKNLSAMLQSYTTERAAILRDKLGWINEGHIKAGTDAADTLEASGNPQDAVVAQTLRLASQEGTPKAQWFGAMKGVELARMNNTARLDALSAKLQSTATLQTALHQADNETRLAVAKMQTEGTLAQVNAASRQLMALNASHQAMTAEMRELGAELAREYRPTEKKRLMEDMAAKRRDQEAIGAQIQSYASAIDDAKSRSPVSPSTLQNRRQFEADLAGAKIDKKIEWSKYGDDNIAVDSSLTPEDQKKIRAYRQKQGR